MDLDAADEALIATLVPEEAIVTGFLVVVTFMDPDTGSNQWKVHVDADSPVSQVLGFLELAKLDVIARSNTGLPINYPDA